MRGMISPYTNTLIAFARTVERAQSHATRWIGGRPLLSIVLLSTALRLGVLFMFPSVFAFEQTGAVHGSGAFDVYSVNLLQTGVYGLTPGVPDAMLPPLYSVFLAGIYAVLGRSGLAVGVVHTALDALSLVLLYHLCRYLFARALPTSWRRVALWTCLLTACYPYLIFQNLTVIDTPLWIALLFAFLLGAAMLRARFAMHAQGWALAVGVGVLLGLATLVRPITPPIALAVAVWFLLRRSPGTTIARLLAVAVVSALVVLPWIVRNTAVYGEFVTMSITTGSNFYQGNNPDVVPFLRAGYDAQWTGPDAAQADPNTPAADAERMRLALDWLAANPGAIPELVWVKFATHWSIDIFPRLNPTEGNAPRPDYDGSAQRSTDESGELALGGLPEGDPVAAYQAPLFEVVGRSLHRLYFGALFLAAIVGAWVSRRAWREMSLLLLMQLASTFVYVVFHPSTRYRAPTDPLLFALAAYLIVWGWARVRRRTSQSS